MSLKYLHPIIQTVINDNSEVTETATSNATVLFCAYRSEKGKDNSLQRYDDLSDFINLNGKPNFKKYGQPIYNAIQWLRGGGILYGMRVLPENAAYANVVLLVKVKQDLVPVYQKDEYGDYILDEFGNKIQEVEVGTGEPVTTNGVTIKLATQSVSNFNSKKAAQEYLDTFDTYATDEQGFRTFPILAVIAAGRGTYGNNISININVDQTLNETYAFRLYGISASERDSNGNLRVLGNVYQCSFYPEAVSLGSSSLFINQVLEEYSEAIGSVFSETVYDNLIEFILNSTKDYVTNQNRLSPTEIDFLFGTNRDGEQEELINIEYTANIDSIEGVYLGGGSNGDFDLVRQESKDEAVEKAYLAAYSGQYEPAILNKKLYEFDVILDANYTTAVKNQIAALVAERRDCIAIVDTNIQPNYLSATSWRKNVFVVNDYTTSIFSQSFVIYDAYTVSDIPVTATYFLAYKIPFNDQRYGIQYPFVGPNRGVITGFKTLDWNPSEDQKEILYKNKINYTEQNFRQTRFMSQLTSQSKRSALSDINNIRVLFRIQRRVETLAENYYFEFASQTTLNSFNQKLNLILQEYVVNGACTYAYGNVYQTQYDREQKIARVQIELAFTGVIERILIEINVGK